MNKNKKKNKKKKEDLLNKKSLLGGVIVIVLLLLVLVTYVMCYDYKKEEKKKLEIKDNSLSVINIYEDYTIVKSETKDSINEGKKILGTYNCKNDNCDVYISNSFENLYDNKYVFLKEDNKVFIYDFISKKIVSNLYDEILIKLENNNYIVKNNSKFGMINNEGVELTKTNYDEILYNYIYDNKMKIKKNDLYGVLDIDNGLVLIDTKYKKINIDSSTNYSVFEDDLWYVIDSKENKITNGYKYTYAFNKGFIALIDNNLQILSYNKETNELLNDTIIPIYNENGYEITKNGSNINIVVYNNEETIKYEYNINRNNLKRK